MSWLVTKDGVSVSADTEAELRLAIAALTVAETPVGSVHLPIEVNAPAWRVGGPPDVDDDDPRPLTLVKSESPDSVPESPTVQHVSVRALQLDVLEAVFAFPEGVTCKGVAELLGLTDKTVSGRM